MNSILITGASGFIGSALAHSMAQKHNVICMSRRNPNLNLPWVRGEFSAFEDLRQLDRYEIDVAPEAEPGEYTLETGFYIPETGERLTTSGPASATGGRIILTTISITAHLPPSGGE